MSENLSRPGIDAAGRLERDAAFGRGGVSGIRCAFELVGGGRASARAWNGATFVASGDALQ
jgi:hypothetical protein